jgi:aminotransferase
MLDSMEGVISLGVGQPDFATPAQISSAGAQSMLDGTTGYTSNYGLYELRERLSAHIERLRGVSYSPRNEILLTRRSTSRVGRCSTPVTRCSRPSRATSRFSR